MEMNINKYIREADDNKTQFNRRGRGYIIKGHNSKTKQS